MAAGLPLPPAGFADGLPLSLLAPFGAILEAGFESDFRKGILSGMVYRLENIPLAVKNCVIFLKKVEKRAF